MKGSLIRKKKRENQGLLPHGLRTTGSSSFSGVGVTSLSVPGAFAPALDMQALSEALREGDK
jgi:hypothetical protein